MNRGWGGGRPLVWELSTALTLAVKIEGMEQGRGVRPHLEVHVLYVAQAAEPSDGGGGRRPPFMFQQRESLFFFLPPSGCPSMTNVPEQKNPVEGGGFQGEERKYPGQEPKRIRFFSLFYSRSEEAVPGFHRTGAKNSSARNPHTRMRSRKGHPCCEVAVMER